MLVKITNVMDTYKFYPVLAEMNVKFPGLIIHVNLIKSQCL